MTVPKGVTNITAQCNGSVVDFPFTFGASASGDLKVVRTDAAVTPTVETTLVEGLDYSVACTNNDCTGGGTVTTVAAYATGNSITILLDIPVSQDAKFTEGMASLYESFELVVDKVTRLLQQQQEQIGRGVQLPVSSSQTDLQIPDPDALKVLRWNSLADALENVDVSTLSAYSIAAFAQSFLASATTVQDGLTLLGLGMYHANPAESDQGVDGNGETLEYFINAIGASSETIYLRAGTYTLTTSLTVPSNVSLVFAYGAVIGGDGVLTVDGPINAGVYQIFNWGLGSVKFTRGAVKEVFPDWWTQNVTPGTTDMTTAFALAAAALPDRGNGQVTVIDLNLISSSIDLTGYSALTIAGSQQSFESEGSGKISEVIVASDITAFTMDYGAVGSHTSGITFSNLKITGYATSGTSSGIYFDTSTFWGVILIEKCDIRGFHFGVGSNTASNAIGWLTIIDCNIQSNYWGVYVKANVLRVVNNRIMQNMYDDTIDTTILDDSLSGGGVYLISSLSCDIRGNDLEGQNIGLYVVSTCQGVTAQNNYFEQNVVACAILRTSYDLELLGNLYSSTNNIVACATCDNLNIPDTRCVVYDGQANNNLHSLTEPIRVDTMNTAATTNTGRRSYYATDDNVGRFVQPVAVDPVGNIICLKWGTNDPPSSVVDATDAAETAVPSPIAKGVRIITQTALNGYAEYALGTPVVGDYVTCIALIKGNALYGAIAGGAAVAGTITINNEWSFVIFQAIATDAIASTFRMYPSYDTSDQICYIGGVVSYFTDYPLLAPKLSIISNTGDFFLGATINTDVPNVLITAGSSVLLSAMNGDAATRQGSSGGIYTSDRVAGTGFTVSTADAAAAAGTERYMYSIVN